MRGRSPRVSWGSFRIGSLVPGGLPFECADDQSLLVAAFIALVGASRRVRTGSLVCRPCCRGGWKRRSARERLTAARAPSPKSSAHHRADSCCGGDEGCAASRRRAANLQVLRSIPKPWIRDRPGGVGVVDHPAPRSGGGGRTRYDLPGCRRSRAVRRRGDGPRTGECASLRNAAPTLLGALPAVRVGESQGHPGRGCRSRSAALPFRVLARAAAGRGPRRRR